MKNQNLKNPVLATFGGAAAILIAAPAFAQEASSAAVPEEIATVTVDGADRSSSLTVGSNFAEDRRRSSNGSVPRKKAIVAAGQAA
jgi:hypothetical protein